MPKMINFQCPGCGAVKEDFEGDACLCFECEDEWSPYIYTLMQPIFSPKNNKHRWRFKDK